MSKPNNDQDLETIRRYLKRSEVKRSGGSDQERGAIENTESEAAPQTRSIVVAPTTPNLPVLVAEPNSKPLFGLVSLLVANVFIGTATMTSIGWYLVYSSALDRRAVGTNLPAATSDRAPTAVHEAIRDRPKFPLQDASPAPAGNFPSANTLTPAQNTLTPAQEANIPRQPVPIQNAPPTPAASLSLAPVPSVPAAPASSGVGTPYIGVAPLNEEAQRRLLARAAELLALGQVNSARLIYERAALSGNAEAALNLGAAYDSAELSRRGIPNYLGDTAKAIFWYERADELGSPEAKARIIDLAPR